jgi:hypothetical protein
VRAYRVPGRYDPATYYRVLDAAHDEAKARLSSLAWSLVEDRIELVEFATDQATLCSLLSGHGCETKVLRNWTLTPRGGLKEVPVGE